MIGVVIDTNILVSAGLNQKSVPALILRLTLNGKVKMFASEQILLEYQEVLLRPHIYTDSAKDILKRVGKITIIVHPKHLLTLSPDEADNRFLECAEEAEADYLITENRKDFPTNFKRTWITSPREFTKLIGPELKGHSKS